MYKCPICKIDVPDTMYHWCGTTTMPDYSDVLERIAKGIERIATQLEAKHG